MKTIGLEEHFVTAEVLAAWHALDPQWQDLALRHSSEGHSARRLADLSEERLAAMADTGIDVAVLSLTAPGVQNLAPDDAVALQSAANDLLADTVHAHPDRLEGFATLATPAPAQAARELERAVTKLGLNGAMLFGRTRERNLDHRDFWPIFEAADALGAPLYLHPQSPPPTVRAAYYRGFDNTVEAAFATHGIGWHYETGVQLLRLILSGVFDRFPNLQVIVGHWGEMVLFYLDRIDTLATTAKLARPLSDYVRNNVFVTPSGVFSHRYLRWAIEIVGVERILFSTDYPFAFAPRGGARRFLDEADLTDIDRQQIASGNWNRLRAGIRR
jgi:predicted TIM-barrel fold metal-dependent hydrolase